MTKGFCWTMALLLAAAAPAWAQRADRPLLQRPGAAEGVRSDRELLRRQLSERPDLRQGQQNRLSPDERRQLRQDIGNAGRELYPRRPQRR